MAHAHYLWKDTQNSNVSINEGDKKKKIGNYLKPTCNHYLKIKRCSGSGLEWLVNSFDTFWLPETDPVHIVCKNICKIFIFQFCLVPMPFKVPDVSF